jgi:hypothetical protein
VTSVTLKNGTTLPATVVVIGAGIIPATSYLRGVEGVKVRTRAHARHGGEGGGGRGMGFARVNVHRTCSLRHSALLPWRAANVDVRVVGALFSFTLLRTIPCSGHQRPTCDSQPLI